jgi:hypothetical protein
VWLWVVWLSAEIDKRADGDNEAAIVTCLGSKRTRTVNDPRCMLIDHLLRFYKFSVQISIKDARATIIPFHMHLLSYCGERASRVHIVGQTEYSDMGLPNGYMYQ